ncbi:MAG: hypothetical protein RLZZ373_2495 [Pseudomonadota bacterium]
MTKSTSVWLQTFVLAVVLTLLAAVPALVFAGPPPQVDLARFDHGLSARALAEGVYVVEGANDDFTLANGCNIINTGFITTGAGVVVVNTGPSRRYGEQLRRLIARTTTEPVVQVVHLNLHPDYFLGNQGFADVPRSATPVTRAGIAREAASYETNLYRLCGDWMLGTETVAPDRDTPAAPAPGGGVWQVGSRTFELREFSGHTASDLVLIDRTSSVGFVGGLVFVQRIPTTPHAQIGPWLKSLDTLDALNLRTLVPSHGPVQTTPEGARDGIAQTRRYLQWLDQQFGDWARQGLEMNEVLRAPVPAEFRGWAAFKTEYTRNVAHLYPVYERQVLAPANPGADR